MDYVERLAREIMRKNWPNQVEQTDEMLAGCIVAARDALGAIAATGCKVVEREMTENQYTQINWRLGLMREECEGVVSDVIDAAPDYPGADDEPR